MATVEQGPAASGLVERIKSILFSPEATWTQIETEPATAKGLYVGYACILAAIGPVAQLIGSLVFGYHFLLVSFRPDPIAAVGQAIVSYVLGLAGIYVLALIIDALAPQFGGQKSLIQALKVAVYSSTAAWLAGAFQLVPQVAALGIVGVYSLYLLYLGLPKLMKAPQDKALTYTIVSIVVAVVVWIVIAAVSSRVVGGFGAFNVARNTGSVGGVVSVGGTQVDLGKLQAASKQMEAAANQMQNGTAAPGAPAVKAIPAETLKGYLPASVGSGYARSEVSSESGGVGGIQGSNAEGVYTKGDARITLTVTDVAAAGALASLATAFSVQSDRETPTGYEKVHTVGGRMTQESWDKSSKAGKYSVMVANRFVVDAEGEGADMSDLKAAVDAVNPGRLEGLAKSG